MEKPAKKFKAHQATHSIIELTLILGVGRERLTRALSDAGMPTNEKMTVAQAFTALSAKFKKQETLERRNEAEAITAEADAAERLGQIMLKKDASLIWSDSIIEVRKLILSKTKWTSKELVAALAKIKVNA